MTREEHLKEVAKNLYEANLAEKEAKANREELRDEFFRLVLYEFKDSAFLPVRTIEVPHDFWAKTGLSKDDFVATRFPGWEVEHIERNFADAVDVFIFKKDPAYMSSSVDVDADGVPVRVSKEISEFSPEIDWKTLEADQPDLFKLLAKKVISYELDEDVLREVLATKPEILADLQRHFIVKKPIQKLTARRIKDGN